MPHQSSEIARAPPGGGSTSSRLLGCFGFSMKVVEETVPSRCRTTLRRRFPWAKKSAARTVPDNKTDRDSEIHGTATSDQAETPLVKETQGTTTVKHATCQKQTAFCRRVVADGGNLGPPEAKQNTRWDHRIAESDPTRKSVHAHRQLSAAQTRNQNPNEMIRVEATQKEKHDPIIGVAIVVVTLLIMIIWGKLCAIFCACTWCYFIPRRLKAADPANKSGAVAGKGSDSNLDDPELSSDEYKKRVVLEGLLERNHRTTLVSGVL